MKYVDIAIAVGVLVGLYLLYRAIKAIGAAIGDAAAAADTAANAAGRKVYGAITDGVPVAVEQQQQVAQDQAILASPDATTAQKTDAAAVLAIDSRNTKLWFW